MPEKSRSLQWHQRRKVRQCRLLQRLPNFRVVLSQLERRLPVELAVRSRLLLQVLVRRLVQLVDLARLVCRHLRGVVSDYADESDGDRMQVAQWHGNEQELKTLTVILERNCRQHENAACDGSCAHRIMGDQRTLDRLIFVRRKLFDRLMAEEHGAR
jgi:hypothetical protein